VSCPLPSRFLEGAGQLVSVSAGGRRGEPSAAGAVDQHHTTRRSWRRWPRARRCGAGRRSWSRSFAATRSRAWRSARSRSPSAGKAPSARQRRGRATWTGNTAEADLHGDQHRRDAASIRPRASRLPTRMDGTTPRCGHVRVQRPLVGLAGRARGRVLASEGGVRAPRGRWRTSRGTRRARARGDPTIDRTRRSAPRSDRAGDRSAASDGATPRPTRAT